jgi:transposase
MTEVYDGRQVVGMDLHRRRSVLVRMKMDGRKLETAQIVNSPAALRAVIARCGSKPLVVVEATCGWYWAADTLEAAGAQVHLAHPQRQRDGGGPWLPASPAHVFQSA